MTFTDKGLRLEDGTTMTTFSATALSTDWLDLTTVPKDWGRGNDLYALFTVTTACTGVGSVEFQVVGQPVTTLAAMTLTSGLTFYAGSANIVTWAAHGLPAGTPVVLSVTAGAPTGVTLGKTYYVTAPTTNTFSLSNTVATALGGTPDVTISTAGTTNHTMVALPLVLGSSGAIPCEALTVGAQVRVRLNPLTHLPGNHRVPYRYLFGKYVEGTLSAVSGAVTAGKWIMDLAESAPGPTYYPSGYAVV
jgi:hypothetical protein